MDEYLDGTTGCKDQLRPVEALPENAPSVEPVQWEFDWDHHLLQQATRAMVGRASGLDSWTPEALLQLPQQWWTALSRCRQGKTSASWRTCPITLLEKRMAATGLLAYVSWHGGPDPDL